MNIPTFFTVLYDKLYEERSSKSRAVSTRSKQGWSQSMLRQDNSRQLKSVQGNEILVYLSREESQDKISKLEVFEMKTEVLMSSLQVMFACNRGDTVKNFF